MAINKQNLNPDNIDEWLASIGFLFPTNEVELSRFDKLYESVHISDDEISIERILAGTPKVPSRTSIFSVEIDKSEVTSYRMVARNGSSLPEHILQKIKMNQSKVEKRDNDKPPTDE